MITKKYLNNKFLEAALSFLADEFKDWLLFLLTLLNLNQTAHRIDLLPVSRINFDILQQQTSMKNLNRASYSYTHPSVRQKTIMRTVVIMFVLYEINLPIKIVL